MPAELVPAELVPDDGVATGSGRSKAAGGRLQGGGRVDRLRRNQMTFQMTRGAAAAIVLLSVASICGCVEAKGDSYPLLTRFPDPPKVLSEADWRRIRESLEADHRAGVAAAAADGPLSTP